MKRMVLFSTAFAFALGCGPEEGDSGVIARAGLEWKVGPDSATDWYQALDWMENLGDPWRMPTVDELKLLYDSGISADQWGPFANSGRWVWAEGEADSLFAWHFEFDTGLGAWYYRTFSHGRRVFAVRESAP